MGLIPPITGDTRRVIVIGMVNDGEASSGGEGANSVGDQLNAVTIKTPVFSEGSASGWFAIMEAQFHIGKIVNTQTRFYHALQGLPPNIVTNIPGEILTAADYDGLKENVVSAFAETKAEIFDKLAQRSIMTGRPSIFLRELQSLVRKAGLGSCDELIRHKFLSALPANLSVALGAQKDLTLSQLGSLADELAPRNNNSSVFNINQEEQYMQENNNFRNYDYVPSSQYDSQINAVSRKSRFDSFPHRSYTEMNIPMGIKPFTENQRPQICRAHIYYADNARSCRSWCKYPNKRGCRIPERFSRGGSPSPYRSESENYRGGSD